ncbi:BQ2448_4293 [Microbotryum intermedium]|uniref:ATP-dependent DNA helicase n=1 Tax=Microbotryum intermedium TaxID=269621 RepID=A0A238FNU3_9BASI|nr:BQ2448_4293 [Microbotryum intermedium]
MLEDDPRRLFFLLAPGGTGKAFVENALLDAVRGQGLIALAVASSGVASLIHKGERTAHATFRIPLNPTDTSSCPVDKESELANLLRSASLIIWDEAPMAHRYAVEAVDRMLRDCLPVVLKGTEDQIGRATIANSPSWPSVRIFELRKNMRLLLRAQDMTAEENACGAIPDGLLLPEHERSRAGLIASVYDGLERVSTLDLDEQRGYFAQRAILAPHNVTVDSINAGLLVMVPGDVSKYRSADDTAEAADGSTTVSWVRCSRRSASTRSTSRVLEGIILTSDFFLPRMRLEADTDGSRNLGFTLRRLQFPVRSAFAMTINETQGQSLERVEVDLSTHPVFSHGQLYVALSRATSAQGCKVLLPPPQPLDDPVDVDEDGDVAMQEARPQPTAATANSVIACILARVHGST